MAALTEPPPAALTCPALGVALAPEAIAAEVLRTLLRDAERELGEPVTKAVIGVPAYFSDEAVAATVRAGEAAGLTTVRTIREPVAAAMAYGFRPDMPEEVILVFDLGGGTFDVSVLVVGGGIVETLSTGGDTRLGGDDFDARVAEHVLDEALGPALGAVAKADPAAMQRLAATSEAVKKALSDNPAVTLRLPFFVQRCVRAGGVGGEVCVGWGGGVGGMRGEYRARQATLSHALAVLSSPPDILELASARTVLTATRGRWAWRSA